MATVSVRNVWKEYGEQVVLENLNLEVADHEFVTIVGASGCGKTTFLKMLLGIEQPDARPDPDRRRADPPRAGSGSRHRVPALLAVPAPHRARQPDARPGAQGARVSPGGCSARAARGARRSARHARVRRARARARPLSGAALRRHAATPVDRAGRDLQAEDPAARRTLRCARSRHHRRHARAHPASCGPRIA